MKIAILGASGFIGSNLAHHLDNTTDHDLTLIDIESRKLSIRFENRAFPFETLDVGAQTDRLDEIVRANDLVINLVATVTPGSFVRSPLATAQSTLFSNLPILDVCSRHGTRLLHFSTSEVYGKANGSANPFCEDTSDLVLGPIRNHRWIYSTAKQMLDRLIDAHGKEHGLDYTILRPFNFIGPLMDDLFEEWTPENNQRVLANFAAALIFGRPLQLVDGGQSRRVFTHIADAVDALALIIEEPAKFNREIVNIGAPGNETTIANMAEILAELYRERHDHNARPRIESVSSQDFYGAGYEDCDRRVPDISKLSKAGWKPKHDLTSALGDALAYCVANKERLVAAAQQTV